MNQPQPKPAPLVVHAHENLNAILLRLGMTTRPSVFIGRKVVVDDDGTEVGSMSASACFRWLFETGRITTEP